MTHPLLIAAGLSPVLRYKNRTIGIMVKPKGIYLGNGKKIGRGFKKDEPDSPEMHPAVMPRRALKFRS